MMMEGGEPPVGIIVSEASASAGASPQSVRFVLSLDRNEDSSGDAAVPPLPLPTLTQQQQQQLQQQQAHHQQTHHQTTPLEEKVERLVREAEVVVFGRTHSPYLKDVIALLSENLCVHTHLVELNNILDGDLLAKYLRSRTEHLTSPYVFVRGRFLGGCEELYESYNVGELERETLKGLVHRRRYVFVGDAEDNHRLATARLSVWRGKAAAPLFYFPIAVNDPAARVTALLVFALGIVAAAFFNRGWTPYLSAAITIDAVARFVAGPSLSPLALVSTILVTVVWTPTFVPGPAKQLDALLSALVSIIATAFFFSTFDGHAVVGCVFNVVLALAAAVEGFLARSPGPRLIELGIHSGVVPGHVNRVYSSTLSETIEAYEHDIVPASSRRHQFCNRNNRGNTDDDDNDTAAAAVEKPVRVATDRDDPVALRYKRKTEEWRRADFDPIRHMSMQYMYCPLSIAYLALAFRIASDRKYEDQFEEQRATVVSHGWFEVVASIAAFVFIFMLFMYLTKILLFVRKVRKELNGPVTSTYFATLSTSFMVFGFLCYDQIFDGNSDKDNASQILGRVLFWMGSVSHIILTIRAVGDWIGRRHGPEHVYPHWLIYPTGFGIAAFCAPIIGPFASDNPSSTRNHSIAAFYYSFGVLLWIVLFVITFNGVVTGHNSDPSLRHGIWLWVAEPAVLGYAAISMCIASWNDVDGVFGDPEICSDALEPYFFISLMLFLVLTWAALPPNAFFGGGESDFTMAYWIDCFALDTLATCSSLFYLSTGWNSSAFWAFFFLTVAAWANLVALLQTLSNLLRKRIVAKPEVKLDPLSFVPLVHDAIRADLPTVQYYLHAIDLDSDSSEALDNLGLFAAHFNRFCIVQDEHLTHEDRVIFKACFDFFPGHGSKFASVDHHNDRVLLMEFCELADAVLDTRVPLRERKDALGRLRSDLPPFFAHLIRHFAGEEQNLDPIGKKYFPLELKRQLAHQVWRTTPAEKWEIFIPYVLLNLPRHEQRVRFLRSLLWSIPERAQQVGAIVYRNVDAVMWERLRVEVREMIPRGAPHWSRYY